MGLHTGEPKVGAERYVGIGVHRAARIGACGHGGQVLLSSTTKELAEEELPPGVSIRDLGERRLKDIDQPQRIYQLDVEGLPSKFARAEHARRRATPQEAAHVRGVGVDRRDRRGRRDSRVRPRPGRLGRRHRHAGERGCRDRSGLEQQSWARSPNVGARPASIAYGSGSLWVANLDDQTVARIDPDSRSVIRSVPTKSTPTSLATTPGAVWVVNANAGSPSVTVEQIDPQFNSAAETRTLGTSSPEGPATWRVAATTSG